MTLKGLQYYITKPTKILDYFINRGFFKFIPDIPYLTILYYIKTGHRLNLNDPKRFNEKMQWLKINYRKNMFTKMADKYEVKSIVKEEIGNKYVIPTIGIYNSFNEIDFKKLPNKFVIKCTHDSGSVFICNDKEKIDYKSLSKKYNQRMKRNYYYSTREWPYKNIKPRILIEKYMKDDKNDILDVYKIFTFSGVPKIIQYIQNDKSSKETIDYYDTNWNKLKLKQNFSNSNKIVKKPQQLNKMLEIAGRLSKNLPFIRVDLFLINGEIYFSEYTFYSDTGLANFCPDEWDIILGNEIKIVN